MAIRHLHASSGQLGAKTELPVCRFCGQSLTDPKVLARYEKKVKFYDAQLGDRLREQARADAHAEYMKKEQRLLPALRLKAEEDVRKDYGRRIRQMEQSNHSLQRELDASKRRLEHLSSVNRGAFNEEDLVAVLKQEFPEDRIDRVKRGPAGRADILQEVRCETGVPAGVGHIVYLVGTMTLSRRRSWLGNAIGRVTQSS